MAVYAINKKGADSMRQLENDMRHLGGEMEECCKELSDKVKAEEENLGIYSEELLELIAGIKKIQDDGNAALLILAQMAKSMAEKIDSLVAKGIVK